MPAHIDFVCRNRGTHPAILGSDSGQTARIAMLPIPPDFDRPQSGKLHSLFDLVEVLDSDAGEVLVSLLEMADKCSLRLVCAAARRVVDRRVRSLRVRVSPATMAHENALATAVRLRRWPALREFELHYHNLLGPCWQPSDKTMHAVASSQWSCLQVLRLTRVRLTAGMLGMLAGAHWPALHQAEFEECSLEGAGVAAIARAGWAGQLRVLSVVGAGLQAENVAALAVGHWLSLEELNVGGNQLGGAGAAALSCVHMPSLQALKIGYNNLGPASAEALASAHWPCLRTLDLSWNNVGPADVTVVLHAFPHLTALHLSNNGLTGMDLGVLAACSGLRTLELKCCQLDAGGVASLVAVARQLPHLQQLDLAYNAIGEGGMASLARASWPCLRTLNLRGFHEGCAALLTARWRALQTVRLPVGLGLAMRDVQQEFVAFMHGLPPDQVLDGRRAQGFSPLHDLAAGGHCALLKELLRTAGTDANLAARDGSTPLQLAAAAGQAAAVAVLLEAGAGG